MALSVGNKILMFQHAIYSVISPEGCASIFLRTADKAKDAARALKITASDLIEMKIIDEIIPEPLGGAHRDPEAAFAALDQAIKRALDDLISLPPEKLKALRRKKFLNMGSPGAA